MTELDLKEYKDTLKTHLFSLHKKRITELKLFSKEHCCLKYNIFVLNAFIDFLDNNLYLGLLSEYDNNIIEYCSLIDYVELVNKALNTDYKPTFLIDVTNNKSITHGF